METQSRHVEKLDIKKMAKLPIINKYDGSKKYDEKEERYLREARAYEFMNNEEPGCPHQFSYQGHKFELLHSGRYKLPRFIAEHIESVGRPDWGWKPDGLGNMQKNLKGDLPRFQMREVRE